MSELGVDHFGFVNCYHVEGHWDHKRVDRAFLHRCIVEHEGPILALGGHVSAELKRMKVGHHRMPHPSYRNRVLNDHSAERDAINSARNYLERDHG